MKFFRDISECRATVFACDSTSAAKAALSEYVRIAALKRYAPVGENHAAWGPWRCATPSPAFKASDFRGAFLLLGCVLLITTAFAASTDARFKDLGHRMMCTCGCGQILLECNHVGCQSSDKMRNELQSSLDRGDNDDLILQGFVQEYGPTVIAAPTAKGFNKIAWIMPFVVLAAGIVFVTWVVRAWKNRPEPVLADGISIPKGPELDHFRSQARKETDL